MRWHPIDTAPKKDGLRVLVFRPKAPENERVGVDYWNDGRLYAVPCWMKSRPHAQPTHWMPLPEEPKP